MTFDARVMAAPSGGLVSVRRAGRDADETVSCDRQLAAAVVVGDWVRVDTSGYPLAFALLGAAPGAAPAPTPPAPTGVVTTGREVLSPQWSGTWRDGWRSAWSDLVQGPSSWGTSYGAAFFGRAPASLGTLTAGSVRMIRETYGAYGSGAPQMALLAASGPGASYPTVLATAPGPPMPSVGSVGVFAVPGGWLTLLESGAAGGIGINGTTYMRVDGPSLTLTLDWSR